MWVLITFLTAVLLFFLEFFLPGAVLGVLGVISLMASMVLGFYYYSPGAGLLIFVGEIIGAGAMLIAMMKAFPKTGVGRRMILQHELGAEAGYVGDAVGLTELVGRGGVAETDLRPSGVVRIDGQRVDAVADGLYLEHGQAVEVVLVDGNRVVVKPTGTLEAA